MNIKGHNPYPDDVNVITTDIGFAKDSETRYRVYLPTDPKYWGTTQDRFNEIATRKCSHNVPFDQCFDKITGLPKEGGHVKMQKMADDYKVGQARGASQKAKATKLDDLAERLHIPVSDLMEMDMNDILKLLNA